VTVLDDVVSVNGAPIERRQIGPIEYWDLDLGDSWHRKKAIRYEEHAFGRTYEVLKEASASSFGSRSPDLPGPEGCPERMTEEDGACVVPPGHLFVLGDNRDNSSDSRYWGTVPPENLKGKALFIWWSSGSPDGVIWTRIGDRIR
jgi:signal peptidase I